MNWLPALRQNCDIEEMEMNLQMKNIIAASPGTRVEDDVLMVPIPHQPGPQATISYEKGPKFCPPSPPLWTPIGYAKRIGVMKNSDHNTVTIPEPQICRICDFDEKEHDDDDVLVELGCSCKGQMSRMHRKCILKWYGVRMLLEKLYKCELCNTVLHPKAQLIVARGVADHENGGRAVLMQALKSSLASYAPHIEVDRASTYKELVQLLLDERAEWFRSRHRSQVVVNIIEAPAGSSREPFPPSCSLGALALVVGATLLGVGLYIYLIHHFYGNAAFH